jgi:ribosomal protein S18 acetylase RimI-like enzyme
MDQPEIRLAGPADIDALDAALRRLSADLGDDHIATATALAAACHGPAAFAAALLACDRSGVVGAALFAPAFSTTLGTPGAVVSDLWVAAIVRGTGLGRRLLAEVARESEARWNAGYLRITAYADSTEARGFYERTGFRFRDADRNAILAGDGFRALIGALE